MRRLTALKLWLETAVRAAPGLTLVLLATTILSAVSAPIGAQGVRNSIQALQQGRSPLPGIYLVVFSLVVMWVFGAVTAPATNTLDDRVQRYVHRRLIDLTVSIPTIAHHEDPALADRLALIRREAFELGRGVTRLLGCIRSLVLVVAVASLLWSVRPWLLILLPLSLASAVLYGIGLQRRERIFREGERHRRLADKIWDILTDPGQALEVMCYDIAVQLDKAADRAYRQYSIPRWKVTRRYANRATYTAVVFWIIYACVLGWAVTSAIHGSVTVGDVALLLVIANQVAGVGLALTSSATALTDGLEFFSRYAWLKDYSTEANALARHRAPPGRLTDGIRFNELGFRYAPEATDVISDLNLHIEPGQVIALVGANGAGKSTLVKLLLGMYRPTAGQILIDQNSLDDLDPDLWRRETSAAFQDFVRFEFPAAESIGIGDLPRMTNPDAIGRAATEAGADQIIDTLPDRYQTLLGTQFAGGVSLSGGQWQRIALARGFMRQTPLLMLLDEPASALDAEVEQQIYTTYVRRARQAAEEVGGTGIIVTHRLSSARLADQIIVLQDGKITEAGTHDELIQRHGQYQRMFELQARSYR